MLATLLRPAVEKKGIIVEDPTYRDFTTRVVSKMLIGAPPPKFRYLSGLAGRYFQSPRLLALWLGRPRIVRSALQRHV